MHRRGVGILGKTSGPCRLGSRRPAIGANLILLAFTLFFVGFELSHPFADLVHGETHRAAAAPGGAEALLNDHRPSAESHGPFVSDLPHIEPVAQLVPHPLLIPVTRCPEGASQEPPAPIPI